MSKYLIKRSGSQYEIVAALRRWRLGKRLQDQAGTSPGKTVGRSGLGRWTPDAPARCSERPRARSVQQRLGRRLVGDEAVDEPAADGRGDAGQLAAALGRGD